MKYYKDNQGNIYAVSPIQLLRRAGANKKETEAPKPSQPTKAEQLADTAALNATDSESVRWRIERHERVTQAMSQNLDRVAVAGIA